MSNTQGVEGKRFTCSLPTKVMFGAEVVKSVGEEVSGLGRHAMVVAAAETMKKIGALQQVVESLERSGVAVTVFDDVQSDPTVEAIDHAARICAAQGCDVVVGLGGGSAVDFAKGVAVGASHPGSVLDYIGRPGYVPKPVTAQVLPIVAIPTTAGTGAEVTGVAVITVPRANEKHGIISPRIFPRIAIVDPTLMLSVPPRITAATGFDVIGHAVEAFVSKFTSPFSDLAALEALRLVGLSLRTAVQSPENLAARANMAWAATLGGVAIANAGMTVAHGIAQALGGRFHVPHGEAVASCLPETLETILEVCEERLARIADVMGFSRPEMGISERAQACIAGLKALREDVGLDIRLREFDISVGDVSQLVEDVFQTQQWSLEHHPSALDREDVCRILTVRL